MKPLAYLLIAVSFVGLNSRLCGDNLKSLRKFYNKEEEADKKSTAKPSPPKTQPVAPLPKETRPNGKTDMQAVKEAAADLGATGSGFLENNSGENPLSPSEKAELDRYFELQKQRAQKNEIILKQFFTEEQNQKKRQQEALKKVIPKVVNPKPQPVPPKDCPPDQKKPTEPGKQAPCANSPSGVKVTATEFGGPKDLNLSYYDYWTVPYQKKSKKMTAEQKALIDESNRELEIKYHGLKRIYDTIPETPGACECALPGVIPKEQRVIQIAIPLPGGGADWIPCKVVDVGPLYTDDYYWHHEDCKPKAEKSRSKKIDSGVNKNNNVNNNHAGLDLTASCFDQIHQKNPSLKCANAANRGNRTCPDIAWRFSTAGDNRGTGQLFNAEKDVVPVSTKLRKNEKQF